MNIYKVKTNISLFISDPNWYLVLNEETKPTISHDAGVNIKSIVVDDNFVPEQNYQCITGMLASDRLYLYIFFKYKIINYIYEYLPS